MSLSTGWRPLEIGSHPLWRGEPSQVSRPLPESHPTITLCPGSLSLPHICSMKIDCPWVKRKFRFQPPHPSVIIFWQGILPMESPFLHLKKNVRICLVRCFLRHNRGGFETHSFPEPPFTLWLVLASAGTQQFLVHSVRMFLWKVGNSGLLGMPVLLT